jgi:twinkle protein
MTEIYKLADYYKALEHIGEKGYPRGPHPGWQAVEELYRPFPGYMTTITGIPGHGKSEWLDALLVNLAWQYGLKFVFFSPENFPVAFHAIKLIEKAGGNRYPTLSKETRKNMAEWVDEHFTFLYPSEENSTLPDIIRLAEQVKETFGMDGFIIDPWNEIDHRRPEGLSETEYISQSLTKVRRFSRDKKVHTWIVAHPTKMPKDKDTGKYAPPTPYDISGSAHWRNKADFCITVHRHSQDKNEIDLIVNKVKFKHFGKTGNVSLDYDYISGRFKDANMAHFDLPQGLK